MTEDFRDHEIAVYVNRWATGKIDRAAPQDAWRRFHASWRPERITAHQLAVEVWRGYSFAPVFDGRKIKKHFREAWHVALDFDCSSRRAKIETLLEDDFIRWFSSFLYYTPSSHPPFYRARVVFVLDEPITSVDAYEALLQALAWKYPDSDQSTVDAARFFYGSKGCDLHGNWSILATPAWERVLTQWRESNPPRAALPPPPPANVQEAEVADALEHIPRRMEYHEWLSVLMAVHSAFPDRRGVQLCENWSPGYEGEIEDKFASFDRTRRGGITVRTLFRLAQDNGWHNPGQQTHAQGGHRTYSANDLRASL